MSRDLVTPQSIIPDLLNDIPFFIPKDYQSKVINYSGVAGLQKVTENSLRADGELRIFEIETMGSFLNFGFCEEVREGFVKNKIKVKELTNQKKQTAWTNVSDFVEKFWECRYISPEILTMQTEILIYNDVVTFYTYKNGNILCVEIYNQSLAAMQKEIFDFMWKYAKKLKAGPGGETIL